MGGPAELRALTGLRFVLALGILLHHYGGQLVAWAPAPLRAVRVGGYVWVSMFFVLSGFVLARAYAGRTWDAAGRREFLAARLARLYPLYVVALALSAPPALAQVAERGAGAVTAAGLLSLGLVQAWVPSLAHVWNGPGWATSAVLAFALLFPFLSSRLGPLPGRRLAAAGVLAWCACLVAPLVWLAVQPDGAAPLGPGGFEPWANVIKRFPPLRALEFTVGVAAGILHARGEAHAPPWAAPVALAAVPLLLMAGAVPYLLLHNGLLAPLYVAAILGLATGRGLLARALASRPAVALGQASFALYILQEPLWHLARALPFAPAKPKPAFVALFVAGAIAAALAAHRLLERPARRLPTAPTRSRGMTST